MSRPPQIQTAASAPAPGAPTERALLAEVEIIRVWLDTHPSVSANALSLEAGLGRNSLTNLLRETNPEMPTVKRLDKLYSALANYGFPPQEPPLCLSALAVEQLSHLSTQGYALRLERDGSWAVVCPGPAELPAQELKTIATGRALEQVLTQVVNRLTTCVSRE
jgi:hypothetical protein